MFTYLDLKNASKHFYVNYHVSAAIISSLDKIICENTIYDLGDLYDLENDIETYN